MYSISLGDSQFRVLSGKVLRENTTRPKGGLEIFPANMFDLAGQDTELPLPCEIEKKRKVFVVVFLSLDNLCLTNRSIKEFVIQQRMPITHILLFHGRE